MDNNSSINKLLDFLGDAVLIVNETSKIVFSNNACCTLLGYSKNELLDMQLSELINPSSINTHDENVARFIKHQSAPKVMSERNLITCYKKMDNRLSYAFLFPV
ncbi:PAS domain-containing protein [Photobacterium leiognathi]|uniref:PAS domain-containing protein n=1 Tax=Photobacterium leiognathi TaxID=553611 RepID=UPI0029815776|nr:PAS domain-containing protein [Photobacterium leiognathi]